MLEIVFLSSVDKPSQSDSGLEICDSNSSSLGQTESVFSGWIYAQVKGGVTWTQLLFVWESN